MSNPLVARPESQTTSVTGIGIAESAQDLANGVKDGSWVEFGMGALGVGMEVLSMVIDPIGTLAQYGVSWLIEHVKPLKDALDWLAGNPPVIQSFADTWANVAKEVDQVAGDLSNEVKNGTAGWSGEGAEAYRGRGAEQADAIAGAATLADGISTGVMIMGQVVAMVRETVRDLVAELVGKLISWALEEACTLGFATPLVAAQATTAITNGIRKVSDLIRKLVKTVGNVAPKLRKIIDKLGEIIEKLAKLGRKIGRRADGTTPSAAKTGKIDSPELNGGTTPSGTHAPDADGTDLPGSTRSDGTTSSDGGSSPNRPKDPNRTKTPENGRKCENDPVDVATGEMVLAQTDVELAGALPLVLRRVHVSSYRAGRSYGRSWASTVDQRLEFDRQGAVYVGEDGLLLVYPEPPVRDPVLPEVGPRWPLERTETGFAIRRRESGQTLRFGPAVAGVSPLNVIVDRNGNQIEIDRDIAGVPTSVRHSGGYHIDVDSQAGRITELRLRNPDGADVTLIRYRYHDSGQLAEVLNSANRALRFDYDLAGRITQWTDRNDRWYRYFYDARGRCVANQGASGFLNGAFTYDDENRITRFTDALGQTVTYQLNERHQIIAETDPLGHRTTQEWDPYDRLLSRTDPLGRTIRYEYDEAGDLRAITRPDGSRILAEYDQSGLPTAIVEPDGAVWRREYDERGNCVSATDPAGSRTRYSYDEHGNLRTVTDALGNTRRITTDAAGLPLTVTDALGATTRCVRDQFGRVASVVDPLGGVSLFSWTVEGKLLSSTRPDGTAETWRYDAEGNQVEYRNPAGQVIRTEYTHFDLPSAETGVDGARLEFSYDATLRLTAVTNPQGLVWSYEYDPTGNVVQETDFNGRVLRYRHDAAGQLIERVNGAGETIRFKRDALGNAVEQSTADSVARCEYDPAGRIVRAANGDAELRIERDVLGRVVAETVNGRTVLSRFDPLGRRTFRRTPTGSDSHWEFDANHRPASLRTGERTLTFGYDVAGREVERLLDTGTVLAQVWDGTHRLTSQTLSTVAGASPARQARVVQKRRFHYRQDNVPTLIEDMLAGTRHFDLDPAGRVTAVRGQGWQERYVYDAAGNVTAADSRPREYSGTLIRAAGGSRYWHDGQGRLVRREDGPVVWQYRWDAYDRLVEAVTPEGVRWRYLYDPLGRRIAKRRLAADGHIAEQTDFTWDGTVLAEQTGSTGHTTTWNWRPGTFRALTQTERVQLKDAPQEWVDRQFHTIVTDLVGTPTELVDTQGEVSWRSRQTVWGEAPGNAVGGTPLRFPGQYYDAETGLHYNFHRYYDPGTGRYGSNDPLGLQGGPTPHSYVPNPAAAVDPLGLFTCEGEAEPDDPLVRLGDRWESTNRLGNQAERAESVDADRFGHGVSVSGSEEALARTDAGRATRRQIEEAGFEVRHSPTRNDKYHHTVQLPKPMTPEAARRFNELFGRSRR